MVLQKKRTMQDITFFYYFCQLHLKSIKNIGCNVSLYFLFFTTFKQAPIFFFLWLKEKQFSVKMIVHVTLSPLFSSLQMKKPKKILKNGKIITSLIAFRAFRGTRTNPRAWLTPQPMNHAPDKRNVHHSHDLPVFQTFRALLAVSSNFPEVYSSFAELCRSFGELSSSLS